MSAEEEIEYGILPIGLENLLRNSTSLALGTPAHDQLTLKRNKATRLSSNIGKILGKSIQIPEMLPEGKNPELREPKAQIAALAEQYKKSGI